MDITKEEKIKVIKERIGFDNNTVSAEKLAKFLFENFIEKDEKNK